MVAPPYDVITPEDQRRYYSQDPRNVVRLIAGEVKVTDHAGDSKYTRAAAFFDEWLRTGVLRRESSACFYVYRQTFPDPQDGRTRARVGILCVVELEPFGSGVLAHERTHARPKADRLSLTHAVSANLSPVFALYLDPAGALQGVLAAAMRGPARVSIAGEGEEQHALWCVRGEEHFKALAQALEPSPLFIADGHHRYETALNYRDRQRAAHPDAPADAAFNYVLMLLVNAEDPNLVILPTHRLLRDLPDFDSSALLVRLGRRHQVRSRNDLADLLQALHDPVAGHRVGVVLPGRYATVDLARRQTTDPVAALDVSVLHGEVFEKELGLHEGILEEERHVAYSRDARFVLDQVERGLSQAAFLLRPPAVSDVLEVARSGCVMPQKSTYFYPKPLSGLVFNPLGG